MGYLKHIMIDQMELEQFVEEYRGTGCATETTRVMRDNRGRFERVYGEVYQYDNARQIFIPNCGIDYIIEPAPASTAPVGYHGLNEADL